LCLRSFDGPKAGKKEIESAAKQKFANEITARKFMATPPEDEPRVERLVIPPGGTLQITGDIAMSTVGGPPGEGSEIVFAGPITEAEEKALNDAGIYPDVSINIATCDDCGKKIVGDGPLHMGPITLDGIEEWCDECDKKPKRSKRRRA
jgi:hypothetical protein